MILISITIVDNRACIAIIRSIQIRFRREKHGNDARFSYLHIVLFAWCILYTIDSSWKHCGKRRICSICHNVFKLSGLMCCSLWIHKTCIPWKTVNPFPHIDAFWRHCSRRLFENILTKEEIAQNVQFLLLPQCFPLVVIGYQFNYGVFLCFDKIWSKSSAAELSYEGKGWLKKKRTKMISKPYIVRSQKNRHAMILLSTHNTGVIES